MIEDKIVDKDNVSIVERYKVIDVIKGYGICLMVCGHSGAPFTNWIYLFHMALFFIASGYLWNCVYAGWYNCSASSRVYLAQIVFILKKYGNL